MLFRLHESVQPLLRGNRFDRMEWAGAFGDLGTLIPFIVAYLSMLSLDPFGVLFSFGLAMIVCGIVYRTPFPVQPMKAVGAIATTQAAQTLTVTAGAVYAASLASGAVWLLLGLTGAAQKVTRLVGRPVIVGIILGLGFGFMLSGVKMIANNWWIGSVALGATLMLLGNRRFPAMFLLLIFGGVCGIVIDPRLAQQLAGVAVEPRLPTFALAGITWNEFLIGTLFLALPQVPLTLGNAIIAITEENNQLFPDRPVTEQRVAVSTGLMNLGGAALGGIPMCHGAGGMAGHVRIATGGGGPSNLQTLRRRRDPTSTRGRGLAMRSPQQGAKFLIAGCLTRTIESYRVRAFSPSQSNAVQRRGMQNDAATFSYTPMSVSSVGCSQH